MVLARRLVLAVLGCVVVLMLGSVAVVLAAGDANEAFCPQETESSPGFRSYLPDCRGYELVTPPFKSGFAFSQGFETKHFWISPDGSRVLITSAGVVAGAEEDEALNGEVFGAVYGISRGPGGWQVESVEPPASYTNKMGYPESNFVGASADTTGTLWELAGDSAGVGGSGPMSFAKLIAREPGGAFEEVGPIFPASVGEVGGAAPHSVKGASADLGTVIVSVQRREAGDESGLWPGDETVGKGESLYMFTGLHDAAPELVGVDSGDRQISQCGTWLGSKKSASTYDAVSDDGRAVFFTAAGEKEGGCALFSPTQPPPTVNELYVRVDGDVTVAISEPQDVVGREPATFQGASAEPSGPNRTIKVFFTTEQSLSSEDGDSSNDLYEADVALGEPGSKSAHLEKLVMVSHGEAGAGTADGNGAKVLGVARVSADGSHVFYVAQGRLTDAPNSEGAVAQEGTAEAPNLYSFDTETGRTSFVGTLSEADEADWSERDARPVQSTPNGRYLLFPSQAVLTHDDSSTAQQLFEYDSEDGRLVRVSIGQQGMFECPATQEVEEGYNCDGNTANAMDAPMVLPVEASSKNAASQAMGRESGRVLTDNGDVFFASEDKLTELALEGTSSPSGTASNVYEYADGNVYLVSDGKDESVVEQLEAEQIEEGERRPSTLLFGTDLSGDDAFFQSADQLVPQDSDAQVDLYDARREGGFPAPVSSSSCGEDCQGTGSSSSPLLSSAASNGYSGGVNLPPPVPAAKPSVKPKPKALTRAQKLARALRACAGKPRRKRAACVKQAHKRYGTTTSTKASRSQTERGMK